VIGDAERGQTVLLAGVAVALVMATLLAAFLQLGYHADVATGGVDDRPVANAERMLERATRVSIEPLRGEFDWSERDAMAKAVRNRLSPRLDTLEAARVDESVLYTVGYNHTVATRQAASYCPSGPARQFGTCVADGGLVLQDRGDQTHVLAVAYDLTVTTQQGHTNVTLVVNATR